MFPVEVKVEAECSANSACQARVSAGTCLSVHGLCRFSASQLAARAGASATPMTQVC